MSRQWWIITLTYWVGLFSCSASAEPIVSVYDSDGDRTKLIVEVCREPLRDPAKDCNLYVFKKKYFYAHEDEVVEQVRQRER